MVRIVQLVKVSEIRVIGFGISITKEELPNAPALAGGCSTHPSWSVIKKSLN